MGSVVTTLFCWLHC